MKEGRIARKQQSPAMLHGLPRTPAAADIKRLCTAMRAVSA